MTVLSMIRTDHGAIISPLPDTTDLDAWAAYTTTVTVPGAHAAILCPWHRWHRAATAMEDNGWEIRDHLSWFTDREMTPIILARRPLIGTIAANVLAHGAGAVNIEAGRVGYEVETWPATRAYAPGGNEPDLGQRVSRTEASGPAPPGRWPPNVLLHPAAAAALDSQTPATVSRTYQPRSAPPGEGWGMTSNGTGHDDAGGASRFYPEAPDLAHVTAWLTAILTRPGMPIATFTPGLPDLPTDDLTVIPWSPA